MQPVLFTALSEAVGVTGPQLSLALAEPRAASMSAALGLQPSVVVVPVAEMTGGSVSAVQVTVRETGSAALPQASVAVQVRVCERMQPFMVMVLSEALGVTEPQPSLAEAVPSAASIS